MKKLSDVPFEKIYPGLPITYEINRNGCYGHVLDTCDNDKGIIGKKSVCIRIYNPNAKYMPEYIMILPYSNIGDNIVLDTTRM